MRRLALLPALVLVVLAVPAAARANGDPASDVLLASQVFLPFEAPISKPAADELTNTVAAANKQGYKIRVAVIPFTGDLGTAVSLWKRPEDYSRFLGSEIAFVYANRLLVAMPSGFGFYDGKKPVAKELHVLAKVKPGATPTALAQSATEAVGALAAATGIRVKVKSPGGGGDTRDRLILGAAVLAFLVVLLVPAGALRRRRRRPAKAG